MSVEILSDEQQRLLEILKRMQQERGSELKRERTVPKTVIVYTSHLANELWGEDGRSEEERSEKILGMFSTLISKKVGIRQMHLATPKENNKAAVISFRFSPVGKEKTQIFRDEQIKLGRKRRSIFATDEEWTAAVKLIEEMRHATISLDTPQ